ncbi:MAG: hypothetical protein HRU37_03150 [Roseibacillus sp.]|nr:hypothetical protein [Roseibacillus sp.]
MASRRARRRAGSSRGSSTRVWLGRLLVGILVLGALLVPVGYMWLKNYLRSDGFRLLVNLKVSEALEVEAEFDKFKWDGIELSAPNFIAEGEGLIRRIEAEELKTEVRFVPLLRKRVETEELQVRRLHVEVDVTRDGPQFEESGRQVVKFETARIDELSGVVDFGETALRWDEVKGILKPGQSRGSYEAALSRGQLLTPLSLFPILDLQKANLRYIDDELILKNGSWKVFSSGRLATEGEIDFGSGDYFFEGSLDDVQCDEVVPEDWAKRITGELTSNFTVEGEVGETPLIAGDLRVSDGHLTALPVLDRIASYTATERFRRLSLRRAELKFRQEGKRLELTDIVVVSDGLLRIEGSLTIEDGQLDGDLHLGLTPSTLASIPGAAHRVFHPGREGLHWAPVKITGTTKYPREDLSDRLIAAGFEWMYEMVNGQLVLRQGGKVAGEVAKTLWKTGGAAAELGAEIIGRGSDILSGIPNPVKPLQDGVGSVIEGILGLPRGRDRNHVPGELPELPGEGKEPGKKEDPTGEAKEKTPADEQTGRDDKKEGGLPLLRDLGKVPGKALDLIGRELGIESGEKKAEGEEASGEKEKRADEKEKSPGTGEKGKLPNQPPKKQKSLPERELGIKK